jgi:anti-sigma factor RsiW
MTTCNEVLDFLGDYLSGELPAAQRAEFERHLAVCPPCVAYLKSYELTIRLGKAACADVDEKPPEELINAILAARSKKG